MLRSTKIVSYEIIIYVEYVLYVSNLVCVSVAALFIYTNLQILFKKYWLLRYKMSSMDPVQYKKFTVDCHIQEHANWLYIGIHSWLLSMLQECN